MYKRFKNYEKWSNWNLKAVTFKALWKKKKALIPRLYTIKKKKNPHLADVLYIIQPLRKTQ